jgi:hypothetical protein
MSIRSRALHQAAGITRRSVSLALVPLVLLFAFAVPAAANVGVSITIAPPALPVYVQPPCPADGYIWTPGYWAWADGDYYWVPGTWVLAPEPGLLWTPGYWAWEGVGFVFHEGYWAPHVGFYGGINYGFGYGGVGFEGGYWRSGRFYYNRAIANVSVANVHNVYTKTVIHNTINVVSYNGGSGGTTARPTAAELRAAAEVHLPPLAAQIEHTRLARTNPALRAVANHGRPPIAATPHVGQFNGRNADAKAVRDMQARQQKERSELAQRHAQEEQEVEAQQRRRHPEERDQGVEQLRQERAKEEAHQE